MSIKPKTFYVLERGTYYEKNVLCNVCSRRSSIFSRMYKDGHSSYHAAPAATEAAAKEETKAEEKAEPAAEAEVKLIGAHVNTVDSSIRLVSMQ